MTRKCDSLPRALRLIVICVASRRADTIRSYNGLSIDMWIPYRATTWGRPNGIIVFYVVSWRADAIRAVRPRGVAPTIVCFIMMFRAGADIGSFQRYHTHINGLAQQPYMIQARQHSTGTDYGPSGPTPSTATFILHHLPLHLGRSAALCRLRKTP